jgi:hypothetical protein
MVCQLRSYITSFVAYWSAVYAVAGGPVAIAAAAASLPVSAEVMRSTGGLQLPAAAGSAAAAASLASAAAALASAAAVSIFILLILLTASQ